MRSVQNALLAALLRCQRFIADNTTLLMSVVDLTVALKRLDDVIAKLMTHAFDQDATKRSAKGETEKQRQLRVKLRTQQMRPIAEIARRDLRKVPEFKALQLPPRSAKGGAFLASAEAMADAAKIQKEALLARGLPGDFLDQFQSLLGKFTASVSDREMSRNRRQGATEGLVVEEKEGRSVLKVLDALVRRALEGNDALLATWDGARTIHVRAAGPAATPSTVTTPANTTPASTPAPATVTAA
jgi:hypothetical protein